MISFQSDYICGAHPEILKRFMETNMECLPGYGSDVYCKSAAEKIKKVIGKDVQVEFLVGGTQTNAVVISTMLADHEGVVAAKSGHISVHEAGAIEYNGHEVLTIGQENGKINAEELDKYISDFYEDESYEHMTFPGMVYISHPTEYGTLYTKAELTDISNVCRKYNIPLYMDGARLGYGLMSRDTDVSLQDIADLCDVFYIGGTKVGALCGEAVVFTRGNKPKHFMTSVKKRGALLAKGRVLGIQFDTLFTDDLYFKISKHAIDMAEKLKSIIRAHDLEFYINSPTNQQFIVLENRMMERLANEVAFEVWERIDDNHSVIRLATSWSTTEEDLRALDEILQ